MRTWALLLILPLPLAVAASGDAMTCERGVLTAPNPYPVYPRDQLDTFGQGFTVWRIEKAPIAHGMRFTLAHESDALGQYPSTADFDLHVYSPDGGHIYQFMDEGDESGVLDIASTSAYVLMFAGHGDGFVFCSGPP